MFETNPLNKIIDNYTESTQMPVMYIDNFNSFPTLASRNFDFASILEYVDFDEVLDYLRTVDIDYKAINTFYTKSQFVYNIVKVNCEDSLNGFMVSGPILPYFPDEKFIEENTNIKDMPLLKKNKYQTILRTLPLASEERINQLSQLLYVLTKSDEDIWYSAIPKKSGNSELLSRSISYEYEDDYIKESEEIHSLYKFGLKLKDKILHGNRDGFIVLLNDYSNLFWSIKSFDDNFQVLKIRCIIICAAAFIFASQGNASYKRLIPVMQNFSINVMNMNSEQEIILKTAHTIDTFTYLTSIADSNNYSLHINRVLQYLKSHYSEKITLRKVAEYIGLSDVYLSSLIKKETNLSLLENINSIRIEEGKNLLILTNKPIHEIAYILGYNYQNHFNKVFKKFAGMTPLEFRQNFGRNYIKH